MSTTKYTVIGKALTGCTATASAWINTFPLPTPVAHLEPSARVCKDNIVIFKGSGAFVYEWTGPGNLSFTGASVALTANNFAMAGTYTLTAFDEFGCKGKTYINLAIDPLPQGTLDADIWQGCVPFCTNFNFVPVSATSPPIINQYWSINKTPVVSNRPDRFSKCFYSPGSHVISGSITGINGCSNTLTYWVTAHPQPVANFTFSPEKPIENTDAVSFINISQGKNLEKFNWFFMNNTGFSTNREHTAYLFPDAGIYPVALRIEDENGCSDTIVKAVTVSPDFLFFVPNAFTPNDDGKNELFIPVSRGIKLYEFSVFNRWGESIFTTSLPNNGWDGNYKGNPCQQDIYVWKASLSTTGGEMKELTGTVILYR
jgi:gliding motility-associated-like protein